jgi:hypothetical protein
MEAGQRRNEWLEKHKDAHFLVFDTRTRLPLGAIYYAPDWHDTPEVRENELKRFFALVQQLEFERGEHGTSYDD